MRALPMQMISCEAFSDIAKSFGLNPSEGGLDYFGFSINGGSRFWTIPGEARRIPFFLHCVLDGLDPWNEILVMPNNTSWASTESPDGIVSGTYRAVVLAGGLPENAAGAAVFRRDEIEKLITVLFGHVVFGWCVSDDLYLLPDHGKQFLQTSHHDVVHASFADPERLIPFIRHMNEAGFPLPDALPDATFKRPSWMPN